MGSKKYLKGMKAKTNEGYDIVIIDNTVDGSSTVKIKFLDDYGYEKIVSTMYFLDGKISNPYHRSVFGVGFEGVGEYSYKNNKTIANLWRSIIRRGYSEYTSANSSIYKNVTVCEDWHCFQNFAKWYDENYPKETTGVKFALDKDLLQNGVENKIYSPSTCIFLPQKVNNFLTNIKCTNSTGFVGISYNSKLNVWTCVINDFNTSKRVDLGSTIYEDKLIDLSKLYIKYRIKNIESVLKYLIELNYLNVNTINRIKNELIKNAQI